MKAVKLNIKPFLLTSIITFRSESEINCHTKGFIKGVISAVQEKENMDFLQKKNFIQIEAEDENGLPLSMFNGKITGFHIRKQNEVRVLELSFAGDTKQMDYQPITHSFQEPNLRYRNILDNFGPYSNYAFIMDSRYEDIEIKDPIVQHKETDWDFAIRLASHFNSVIVPDDTVPGIKYYFGLPKTSEVMQVQNSEYRATKDLSRYNLLRSTGVDQITENDFITYEFIDREIYKLGQEVIFQERNMFVSKITAEWIGQELVNRYILKSKNGLKQSRIFADVSGVNLEGRVSNVTKDKVQIELICDENNPICGHRWIDFATVYSTPDGSGWYAMPEIGDAIHLYFPNDYERDFYVMNAIHKEPHFTNSRIDPDRKSFRNIHGKELVMTPDKMIMTNNKGMSVTLDDGAGISIVSDKSVNVTATDSISIISNNSSVTVAGATSVDIEQENSAIRLTDDVVFKGTEMHVQ